MRWLTRHAKVLLAVYAVFLGLALLSPSSDLQSDSVAVLGRWLYDLGVPYHLAPQLRLEFLMNAVIIAPVPFLGSMILPQYTWRDWTALGFTGALTVEALQGLLLPDRSATYTDVVANTLGAFIGAGLAELSRRSLRARVA
jgi:glycopeptide antibiotics resistance protein